jgi:hypothetical protein
MLGVNFAGGNGAAVSDTERFSLPATGQCDLAAYHHDARIPIMCVVGVHHPRLETTIENLVTLASKEINLGVKGSSASNSLWFMTSPPAGKLEPSGLTHQPHRTDPYTRRVPSSGDAAATGSGYRPQP